MTAEHHHSWVLCAAKIRTHSLGQAANRATPQPPFEVFGFGLFWLLLVLQFLLWLYFTLVSGPLSLRKLSCCDLTFSLAPQGLVVLEHQGNHWDAVTSEEATRTNKQTGSLRDDVLRTA